MSNNDTAIITVRVNKKTKEKIENIANSNKVNLNSIINKILIEYADWEILKKYFDFVQIRAVIIAHLLKNADEESLEQVFTEVKKSFRESIEFIYGEFNFDNFISVVDHWLTDSGLKFRHFNINNYDTYLISHDYGKNFSRLIFAIFSENVDSMGYKISDEVVEDQKLSIKIKRVEQW